MITPDDVDTTDECDWFADDSDDHDDEVKCPFCLSAETRDPAGRLIACCRAMAEAWEMSE